MLKECFEVIGDKVINNLIKEFKVVNYDKCDEEINCPYSIGIEIEVKFKYYFPELYNQYFKNNYYNENIEERAEIDKIIYIYEKCLLDKLEKTIDCGIPKGNDRYWEFSFNPVYNLQLIINIINLLKQVDLIPNGQHSLHINIGDFELKKDIYWVLLILEVCFIDKNRIINGLKNDVNYLTPNTWAKKGVGGIMAKNNYLLKDTNVGVELRTLYIDDTTDIVKLFKTLNYFLVKIKTDENIEILNEIKEYCINCGLEDINWGKPHLNKKYWDDYIDNFDKISIFVKDKLNNDLWKK